MASTDGDFLDSGVYGTTADAVPAYGSPPAETTGPAGWRAAVRPAAWLAAGVVVGVVSVAAWHSSETSTAATNPAAAQGQLPNGQGPGGQMPNGQLPNGVAPNGVPGYGGPGFGGPGFGGPPGFGGSGPGGRTGEQHVFGTVTVVGSSSVTVRLANGSTSTYSVLASSDIVKDGTRVSLSAIKTGDAVFLHVYPSNGRTVVEHLFADDRSNTGSESPSTTKT